jgi:hypothetical protein
MMQLIRTIALGAVTLGALAACGQSDDAFRASYRTRALPSCNQGARSAPSPAGVDAGRLCTCIVERYMAATTTEQLRAERDQSRPPPAAQNAMMQCAQEQARNLPGVSPAPEAGAAPAGPTESGTGEENGAAHENSTAE